MITVEQAFSFIQAHSLAKGRTEVPLDQALNRVLADPVIARFDMPHFRQSAMDGYAVNLNTDQYVLSSVSKAGDSEPVHLNPHEACRIYTGAMVPDEADTVVMQEHTMEKDGKLIIHKPPLKGANIRGIGEQLKAGDHILPKYHQLTPASVGLLAGCGINKVQVYDRPVIGILVTGNELLDPSLPISPGKVYDSNSIMLVSALHSQGFSDVNVYKVNDELRSSVAVIGKALMSCDVLLISGGISVGDYDFVQEALKENNVDEIFYKVKQKPGKPFWFGKQNRKLVFGLPGNPASALTCFYIYVWPALAKMTGLNSFHDRWRLARVNSDIHSPREKALFLKAFIRHNTIDILGKQSSSMLQSFAQANAIAYVPESLATMKKGDMIQYMAIP